MSITKIYSCFFIDVHFPSHYLQMSQRYRVNNIAKYPTPDQTINISDQCLVDPNILRYNMIYTLIVRSMNLAE